MKNLNDIIITLSTDEVSVVAGGLLATPRKVSPPPPPPPPPPPTAPVCTTVALPNGDVGTACACPAGTTMGTQTDSDNGTVMITCIPS